MPTNIPNINIENAIIVRRNFAGAEAKFNPAGKRNFCVIFEDMDLVERMKQDGWNVKVMEPREEGDPPHAMLQVAVSYDFYPPKIALIKGKKKILIDEANVHQLDYVEIENVDLCIRPYQWQANGKTGVKAYLKTMYLTVHEDEFAYKYEDFDDTCPY